MRLIDPIELKRSIAVSSMVHDGKTLEQIIDEQPSVEPEIITCHDCWWNDGTAFCEMHMRDVKGKDFCSWAVRRTDG